MHRVEGDMEPDDEQPEMPKSQPAIEQTAHGFRIPVVDAGEYAKEESTDECVVKVRDDEVGIRELPVQGGHAQHHSGQTRDQELKNKRDAKEHRQIEVNLAAVHCAEPV